MAIDVKIGVLNDRSGVYADLSGEGSVVAARMAVEDFDAAGKGINVEIVSADHQNKPDIASNIARQWYDEDGVDVIVDVPTSSAALAVSEITTREEQDLHQLRRRHHRPDRQGLLAQHHPLDLRHLRARARHRQRHGRGRAATPGSSSPPTTPSATRWRRTPPPSSRRPAARCSAAVRHPFPGQDFSSFLLQAQASGAKVIGLANAGGDTVNSIKQASEFGITQGGQTLAGLLIFITDVHALGLEAAQGLVLTESFYWDLNDDTRAWSERFAEAHGGAKPTMVHAGVYSGVLHYLKAVEATGEQGDRRGDRLDEGEPDLRPAVRRGRDPRRRPQDRTTCTCSRSRRRTPRRARGTTTSSSPPSRPPRPSARSRTAAARWCTRPPMTGGRPGRPRPRPQGARAHVRTPRHPAPGAVRPAPARADQRLVLRDAEPRARGDLRAPQHHQLRPRRPVHDGRLRGLDARRTTSASATGGR